VRIGLGAIDSKMPNLVTMRLAAWHKQQGDTCELWRGQQVDKLYASVIFTRTREQAKHLPKNAILGGTGVDYKISLPPEVEQMKPDYDLYGIDYGLGFLWRGCVNRCPFCVVWRKEPVFEQVAQIVDLLNPKSNRLVLLDNNLTAAPNVVDILHELAERKIQVNFNQGWDIRRITPEIAAALVKVDFCNHTFKTNQIHFAWDSMGVEPWIRKGIATLSEAGIKPYRVMVYMLSGFDTSFDQDMYRFEELWALGVDPYVMVFQDVDGKIVEQDPRLRHFARWVNKRIYKACRWEDYGPAKEARFAESRQMKLAGVI
jgi:hypothetical protein